MVKEAAAPAGTDVSQSTLHDPSLYTIPEYLINSSASHPSYDDTSIKALETKSPILVFINRRSGGRQGTKLIKRLEGVLPAYQVVDLSQESPEDWLRRVVHARMERLATEGDEVAKAVRQRLRLIVCGGDGTVSWLLSAQAAIWHDNTAEVAPPIAVIPLGTGNDFSRMFGWGSAFRWHQSIKKTVACMPEAKQVPADRWSLRVDTGSKSEDEQTGGLPPALRSGHAGKYAHYGKFFNYFCIGLDSQVAYGFHTTRNRHPWLTRDRIINKAVYVSKGFSQGWFCTRVPGVNLPPISSFAEITVQHSNGEWRHLELPPKTRAVIFVNLQSYGGGRNLWGPHTKHTAEQGFVEPHVDDTLLDVVGVRHGWHGASIMLYHMHATRLAQVKAARIEVRGTEHVSHTYMRVDGEPWEQPLPSADSGKPPVVVEIKHDGQAAVLRHDKPRKTMCGIPMQPNATKRKYAIK